MSSEPFDIKLTYSGTDYGFMLVNPVDEPKQLFIAEAGIPNPDRVSTADAAAYQDFPSNVDLPFAQTSWASGVGQLQFDDGDEQGVWWAPGVILHVDGQVSLAPPTSSLALTSATSVPTGFYTYFNAGDNKRYDFCWSGTRIYRRDASAGGSWSIVYTEGNGYTVTDFKAFGSVGVIAYGAGTGTNDFDTVAAIATTFTPTGRNQTAFSSGTRPKFWIPSRGTLFAAVDSGKVFFTVDPAQDGWAGPITTTVSAITSPDVGDSTYPFQNVIAANDYIMAFNRAAGYAIDASQTVTEVFWQWKDKPSDLNFKYVASGGEFMYYSVGNEVYAYDPGTGQNLSLQISKRDGFSVQEVHGLSADNRAVYVLAKVRVPTLYSAAAEVVLRCYRIGGTRWAVEVLWEDSDLTGDTYGTLAAIPNDSGTRLYWGKLNGGAVTTVTMDLPADWDTTTGSSFVGSGVMYTSLTRGNFPGLVKRHLYTGVEGEAGATRPIRVDISLNGGATFTQLDFDPDTGGTQNLTANAGLAKHSGLLSNGVVLKFTLSGTGSNTPILKSFDHHQRPRFRYLPAVQASVRIADNIEQGNGARSQRKADQLRADLELLRKAEAGDITYQDFLGNNFPVSFDSFQFRPTRHEKPENRYEMEALINLTRADKGG